MLNKEKKKTNTVHFPTIIVRIIYMYICNVKTEFLIWTGRKYEKKKIKSPLLHMCVCMCEFLYVPSYLFYSFRNDNIIFFFILKTETHRDYIYILLPLGSWSPLRTYKIVKVVFSLYRLLLEGSTLKSHDIKRFDIHTQTYYMIVFIGKYGVWQKMRCFLRWFSWLYCYLYLCLFFFFFWIVGWIMSLVIIT